MNVTVLGATGYAGMVLLRILARHPDVTRVVASSRGGAGRPLQDLDPGLSRALIEHGPLDPIVRAPAEALADPGDVVFSALPHGASAETCAQVLGRTVVIDLSADFRFTDETRYRNAYGQDVPQPQYQPGAVYGLCEWYRDAVRRADVIANPGCYPTATLLPLLPLQQKGLLHGASTVVVNALSGITGAGKKEKTDLLYAERTENAVAYNPGRRHRHAEEIAERLQWEAFTFTPHLIPLKQGMLVTTVVHGVDPDAARAAVEERYREEPFVTLTGEIPPETRHVRGTNFIRIGIVPEGNAVILLSAIDNLWKGAAGQAVQNMNIRFGLPETAGLLRDSEL